MTHSLSRTVRARVTAAVARWRYELRARLRLAKLPPGRLDPLDRSMDADQLYVLKAASRFGPVFKTWWHGRYTTCVVGHALGRRLLSENEDRLVPRSIDLSGLVPKGWFRSMRGDTHRHYRRLFIQAFQATPLSAHEAEFRQVIRDNLAALACKPQRTRYEIRDALRMMTSTIMLRFLLGVSPASAEAGELMALYRRFGPDAPVDAINQQGGGAFAEIARCVGRLAQATKSGADTAAGPSVLRYLVESGSDDKTALGNLIYMFEPAHFDVYSLWHWVLQHMAEHPYVADRIAEALHGTPADAGPLVQAAVLETLRLAQSEILYREAKSDGTFDGLFFPKGGIVRVCLWEGHKDERTFPEPFAFRPDRFQGRPFEIDEFSPFGLDKHRCIAAEVTVSLTALFLEELLTDFSCELADAGPAELGTYHWEPNAQSKISLSARPSLNPS